MRFAVDRLDHLVLTCKDVEITCAWYGRVLGMEMEEYGEDRRIALRFGGQKINLRRALPGILARAVAATPGSADLCFSTGVPPHDVIDHLHECGVQVERGPVARLGALGPVTSVYCRDPDGNLIEIATYMHL
jgi:catechol 2,3-dioxygenase-like lactoylglutathione lyase family enzyme